MKATLLTGLRTLETRDVPSPEAPEGWARVRMRHVGVCGSDIHYWAAGRIGDQVVKYPFVLGHEGAGEVLDGAGALPPGTPVFVEPAISCGECDQCLLGRENTCRKLRFLGNPQELAGCLCEELVMPARCALPLPASIPLDQAALLEPLAIGVYAVQRSRIRHGQRAAVVGAGPIGLSVLAALGATAGEPLVSEPVEARRRAALALGAARVFDPGAGSAAGAVREASAGGVDVAFECVGSPEAIDDAAHMLAPGGTLVLIGIPEGIDRVPFDSHLMRRQEITAVNIRRQNKCTVRAMNLLATDPRIAATMITHRFPAARAGEAFDLVSRRADGVIKAMVDL